MYHQSRQQHYCVKAKLKCPNPNLIEMSGFANG